MLKRIITGAVLVAIVAGFFLLRTVTPAIFQILILLLSVIGTYEIARAFGDGITPCQKWLAVCVSAITSSLAYFLGLEVALYVIVFAVVAQLALSVLQYSKVSNESVGIALLATLYPCALLVCMSGANALSEFSTCALLVIFIVPSFTDTFAYFVGSIFKGAKLCPSISPKKTISGAIGGCAGGMIGAFVIYLIYGVAFSKPVPEWWFFLIVGVLCSVLTQFGDLVESVIKRKVGIKDMGNILPGHGGIMDRIDGISFVCPIVYVCFRLLLIF